jgi:hypothetical protein
MGEPASFIEYLRGKKTEELAFLNDWRAVPQRTAPRVSDENEAPGLTPGR